MVRNSRQRKNKLKFLMFVVTAIAALSVVLVLNMGKRNLGESEKWDNYMVIGKKNVFVVYGEKLAIQVPYEISMNKDRTLGDIAKSKNYEEVVRSLNEILPEKVENFKVVSRGQVEIDAKSMKQIPEIAMNDKRYVLTSSLNGMFLELYYDSARAEGDNNIIIDVLNANGRSGYAREAGEKLAKTFPLKYNAANFDTFEQYSYIQNKDLSDEKLKEIVMELDEKYFKIKEEGTLPTLANAIVVLGREQEGLLHINIYSTEKTAAATEKQLKRIGYKSVKGIAGKDVDNSFVEYNKADYYTAYKLAERLGIKHMVENKDLKEEINIFIND